LSDKQLHAGHRERMRRRFSENGFENYQPHEVMEQVLFAVIPRANTNETAHLLLNRFGSIENVLDASEEELMTIPGIGKRAAEYLTSLKQRFSLQAEEFYREKDGFNSCELTFLADLSLNTGDYRSAERTFQLLTQAAGRAGRGKREGEAVIQTYRPEHYSVLRASEQDYEAFYEEEILYRELAGYPPAAHMLAILITAKEERAGIELAEQIAAVLREQISNAGQNTVQLIGPAKATVGKINDIYRFVIYLKYKDAEILYELRKAVEEFWEQAQRKNETVQFDFDPIDSY